MNKYLTLLKRECWENRFSFFFAPAIAAVLFVALAIFGNIKVEGVDIFSFDDIECVKVGTAYDCHLMGETMESEDGIQFDLKFDEDEDDMRHDFQPGDIFMVAMFAIGWLFFVEMVFVIAAYFLGTLNDEHKDKSILFWNSFPVSHTETVLSKLFVGLIIIPAVTLIAVATTQSLVTAIMMLRVSHMSELTSMIWANLDLISLWSAYAVNYFVFALGTLAIAGLMLTLSATAFRPAILFVVTLILLTVGEHLITGQQAMITRFLFIESPFTSTSLFGYGLEEAFDSNRRDLFASMVQQAGWTITHPSFWFSVLIGVGLVIAAINMRKYKAEA